MRNYLRLKKEIDIILTEGTFSMKVNDMICLEKIGIRVVDINKNPSKNNDYKTIDCFKLNGIEYNCIQNIEEVIKNRVEIEYHMKWEDRNEIDPIIRIIYSKNKYNISKTKPMLFYEIIQDKELFNESFYYDIEYERDYKLDELLNK